jgi:dTDP-L-rhamnose 4-epimerase
VITVAQTLLREYGIDVPITISGNYRLGDIRHNFADISKIRTHLGFTPKVFFEEGIKYFTQWVNLQEVKASRYEDSIAEMKEKGLFK